MNKIGLYVDIDDTSLSVDKLNELGQHIPNFETISRHIVSEDRKLKQNPNVQFTPLKKYISKEVWILIVTEIKRKKKFKDQGILVIKTASNMVPIVIVIKN